jgi:hypothetical protein
VLKIAADRIYDVWEDACKLKTSRFFEGTNVRDDSYLLTRREMEMFPIYMLLMGYAFENLIKGIIICKMWLRDPNSVEKASLGKLKFTRKYGRGEYDITTHDFDRLLEAEVLDIVPSDPEKDLLRELQECVIWGGKYPTPKEVKPNETFSLRTGVIVMDYERSKLIKDLYSKWRTELIGLISMQCKNK